MNMARRKNGRFTKRTTTRRRRSSKAISITNTAESLIIANAVTKGVFGSDLKQFFSLAPATGNSWDITLGELLNGGGAGFGQSASYAGGTGGTLDGLMAAIKYNLSKNGASMAATVILTPVIFRMAKKVLAKPVIRPARKALKMTGLNEVVKV